ncbi:tetratricopeptide repeat protein [uncultured Tenacibaculum sp.]|uniref:tetratricopeptide repeat protein n=1 Tax=uncultured Tenacibaculum sp. TaxID=174713 RepID=UPI0026096B46|nr:tetratricopeptide repeat protein [uncultured Tenacibaculum sp.]
MKIRLLLFILLVNSSFIIAQSNNFALAENYFRNNEFEKATQILEVLVKKSPYNTTYIKRLISCYQETDKFDTADKLLTQKLTQRPNLTFLNVILGYNYERQQQKDKADKYYKKALKSISNDAGYGGTIARLFKDYNKLDLAIEAYKKALSLNQNLQYEFQIAQIYGEKGDFELMFQEYVNLLDKRENYLSTIKSFSARYITDDSENENNVLFKKALLRKSASNPKNIWNDLLSWLFITQKEYGKAFIQNKALYQRDNDKLIKIYDLGEIAFENKDYETAKKCFDFTIERSNYPEDKFSAILMNLRIAIATQAEDIESQFNLVFNEYGINKNTFSIQVAYADYLTFTKNQPEEAKKVLERALGFSENRYQKASVKLKLADVLVYQNTFNKALIYFSQIQTQFRDHQLGQKARFKVAQTSYFKGDFKWSKAQLKVLKGSTSQLIANDAADLFLIISDNQPKDSLPSGLASYAKADLLSYQNKNDEAITVLDNIITKFKGQSIEDEALFKKAKLFTKKKKFDEAILTYARILDIDQKGILADDVYYNIAELYKNELNNPEKAKEYYQKIIFDYPSSIYLVDARNKFRKLRGDTL